MNRILSVPTSALHSRTRAVLACRGRRRPCSPASRTPRGATLTEVLISLAIMSIGLAYVATLFPLSVQRSVQATQRTQATVLKHNVEAYLDASRWYSQLDSRNIMSDPRLFVGVDLSPGTYNVDDDGGGTTDDRVEVGWSGTDDRGLAVLDPLGVVELDTHVFPYGATGASALPRLNGILPYGRGANPFVPPLPLTAASAWTGYNAASFRRAAEDLCYLPDSYTIRHQSSSVTAGSALDQVIIPGMVRAGISGVVTTDPPTRVVLSDITGKIVYTRPVYRVVAGGSGDTVYFTEDDNANGTLDTGEDRNFNNTLDTNRLPAGFEPAAARVETQEQRYSWMLLIRRLSGDYRELDLVVFFRRGFQVDPPASNEELMIGGSPGAQPNTIVFTSIPKYAKRGGFVIAAHDLETYRIQNIAADGVTMTLIRSDGNDVGGIALDGGGNFTGIFMRGIVDIYPLGVRTPW